MAPLTKIEEELLKEIDKNPYLQGDEIPCERRELKITHRQDCIDPIALFRPQVIICYAGTFRGKEFIAIGGTDEGFDVENAVAASSKVHSILVGKVRKWVRKDMWLAKLLPFELISEVFKGILY